MADSCSSEPKSLQGAFGGSFQDRPRGSLRLPGPSIASQEGNPVSVRPEDPVPPAVMGRLLQTLHLAQRLGHVGVQVLFVEWTNNENTNSFHSAFDQLNILWLGFGPNVSLVMLQTSKHLET